MRNKNYGTQLWQPYFYCEYLFFKNFFKNTFFTDGTKFISIQKSYEKKKMRRLCYKWNKLKFIRIDLFSRINKVLQ